MLAELPIHGYGGVQLHSVTQRTRDRRAWTGLALVEEIVASHGGRVAAHSDGYAHGSVFTLWLPARVRYAALGCPPIGHRHHVTERRSSARASRAAWVSVGDCGDRLLSRCRNGQPQGSIPA
jgi:hypothetical protein